MALVYAAASSVGARPGLSGDAGYADPRLLALASGSPGGFDAATVVDALAGHREPVDSDAPDEVLTRALGQAREQLRDLPNQPLAAPDVPPGAALTALLWSGDTCALAHMGDTGAYLLRDGVLYSITADAGPDVLAAGSGLPVPTVRRARAGDRYLLCSRDLRARLGPRELWEVLNAGHHCRDAVRLILAAAERGRDGPASLTCVLADVVDGPGDLTPVTAGAAWEPRDRARPVAPAPGDATGRVWRVGDVVDGRYEVTRVHEHGGMGLVYRVRHLAWGVDLAVKSPRPEMFASAAADRERFAAEAQTWVSLGLHPNVCGCHYVRTLGGVPRVFAEYVPGGSLHEWIEDGRLYAGGPDAALKRILNLAVQVAWGLEYAHGRGLVHQDVKPANVLIGADGTAKVTDFGLARARPVSPDGASALVPWSGQSPPYASPEQLAGERLGRRTDVYSFAVSVLEMFTGGRTWLVGPAAGEALAAHREEPPEPGRPVLPGDLADLLERCLRGDPGRRPRSMSDVAAELIEVYARAVGRPCPRSAPDAADLRADELNNRALSLLDLGRPGEAEEAFAAALASDPRHLPAAYNRGLLRWRRGALTDRDLIGELLSFRPYDGGPWRALHLRALVELERGDHRQARADLRHLERERPDEPELQDSLNALRSGRVAEDAPRSGGTVPWARPGRHSLLTRPEALRLLGEGRLVLHTDAEGVIRLWDVHAATTRLTLTGHTGKVRSMAATPDARFAVSAAKDDAVRLWDLGDGRPRTFTPPELGGRSWIGAVGIGGAGRDVLALSLDGTLHVWDRESGRARAALESSVRLLKPRIEVSGDGRRALVYDGFGGGGELWDLDALTLLSRVAFGRQAHALRLAPDARTAAVGHGEAIGLWDLETGRHLRTLTGHTGQVEALSLSADGRLLLSGARDRTMRLWDTATGQCVRTFDEHGTPVLAVHLGGDARRATSVSEGDLVFFWDLPDRRPAPYELSLPRRTEEMNEQAARVRSLVEEAERAREAGAYREALGLLVRARETPGHERAPGVLDAWRGLGRHLTHSGLREGWAVSSLAGHASAVRAVDVSADGAMAASGDQDGTVRLWDLAAGRCARVLQAPGGVLAVRLTGDRVLAATEDGKAASWSTVTGERLGEWTVALSASRLTAACFDADGERVLTAGSDRLAGCWNLGTGGYQQVLAGHTGQIGAVWLGSGWTAVTGGRDGARVWDVATGRVVHHLGGFTGDTGSVCLSADERLVMATGWNAGGDQTRVWDAETGARLYTGDWVPRVGRFTPDARFAVLGGRDSTLRIWNLATGRGTPLPGHREAITDLALTPDARHAVTSGEDGGVRLWEFDWDLAPELG